MICVNTRCLHRNLTGVQRYTTEILARNPDLERVAPDRPLGQLASHLWEQWVLPRHLNGRLLWSPCNTGPLSVSRQVVTIHDMATLDNPLWFKPAFARWYKFLLPRLARKVRHVIAISQFSKDRILYYSGIDESKVTVVYNGVGRPGEGEGEPIPDIPFPFFLYVGFLEPRKNLETLIKAWHRFPDVPLVVAGSTGTVFNRMSSLEAPGSVRFLGRVSDAQLKWLYRNAHAFIYPSWYEGFGLPPLEAMQEGCPVIVSAIEAHREVCGAAALYFPPESQEALIDCVETALKWSSEERNAVVQLGRSNASRFSWERTAVETARVLRGSAD